jgi:hypothetical protein
MAPVKPMGTGRNPKTRAGVTGFPQEYNQDPGPTQDLNPDAVTEDSVLPTPQKRATEQPPRAKRARAPRATKTKK